MTTKELSANELAFYLQNLAMNLYKKDSRLISEASSRLGTIPVLKAEIEKYKDTIVECSFECEVRGVDNKALEANNATLGAEIEALKKELQEREEFTKAWILYATKIEMLMPTRVDRSMGSALGLSLEYQKGYNDAILEVKVSLKKASEK